MTLERMTPVNPDHRNFVPHEYLIDINLVILHADQDEKVVGPDNQYSLGKDQKKEFYRANFQGTACLVEQ